MIETAKIGMQKITKNTIVLLLAQIGSRTIAIVYIGVLARYVGADGIGIISTATALCGIMVLMLAPGLDPFLIRNVAVDPKEATGYVSNMLVSRFLLGIPFLVLVVIVSNVVSYSTDTIQIIIVYAFVYIIDNLCEILNSLFRAFQRMEYEAGTQVARDLINFSLSLLAIYLHLSLLVIVVMSLVAQIGKLLIMLVFSYRRFIRPQFSVNLTKIKTLLLSSLPFGGLVVLYAFQNQLGIFVLSISNTPEKVGIFSAANTLISTLVLVPGALSVALFPAFSRLYAYKPSHLPRYYALAFKYMIILGFPMGLGVMLVGDQVIVLIYGHGFEGSTIVIQILGPFLFTFVGYCNSPLLYATGRERFLVKTLALGVVGYALLCIWLIPKWGPMGAAIAYTTAGLAINTVFSVVCHRLIGLSLPCLTVGKVILASGLMGLVTIISIRSGLNWFVVTLTIAPGCYVLLLFLLGLIKREELQSLIVLRSSS